jgi:tRNA pseudouridine38-40 synthase
MRKAARHLVGEHDYTSFRSSECQARSPVRQVHAIDIEQRGAYTVFEFSANAFLHHMVRNLMGTLIYVGKGKHPPSWAREVLAARSRAAAAPTFDAAGLYLAHVEYDPQWRLPDARTVMPPLPDLVQP